MKKDLFVCARTVTVLLMTVINVYNYTIMSNVDTQMCPKNFIRS